MKKTKNTNQIANIPSIEEPVFALLMIVSETWIPDIR